MWLLPRWSTLFPYTSLFRSRNRTCWLNNVTLRPQFLGSSRICPPLAPASRRFDDGARDENRSQRERRVHPARRNRHDEREHDPDREGHESAKPRPACCGHISQFENTISPFGSVLSGNPLSVIRRSVQRTR